MKCHVKVVVKNTYLKRATSVVSILHRIVVTADQSWLTSRKVARGTIAPLLLTDAKPASNLQAK